MKSLSKIKAAVISDGCHYAFTLYRFLRKHVSTQYIICKNNQIYDNLADFDIVFINVDYNNSAIRADKIRSKIMVLFDSYDSMYTVHDNELIQSFNPFASYYLKTSFYLNEVDDRFNYKNLVLPQNKKFPIIFHRPKNLIKREILVDFIGNASVLIDHKYAKHYPQRVEWLKQIKESSLPFTGGITDSNIIDSLAIDANIPDFRKDLEKFFVNRFDSKTFMKRLLNTQISLCPGGLARWTYRHIESILAKCLIISTDFSNMSLLPKLPIESFVTIPDYNTSLVTKIEEIQTKISLFQENVDYAYNYWQTYYKNGRFGRNKLFLEFMSQFDLC